MLHLFWKRHFFFEQLRSCLYRSLSFQNITRYNFTDITLKLLSASQSKNHRNIRGNLQNIKFNDEQLFKLKFAVLCVTIPRLIMKSYL
jgi:hypothetical protein